MSQTKKNNMLLNVNEMIKEELLKSKFIKSSLYIGAGVVGLFALGFVLKALNYSADNFKNLQATLKR
jgi:hypothetical protein